MLSRCLNGNEDVTRATGERRRGQKNNSSKTVESICVTRVLHANVVDMANTSLNANEGVRRKPRTCVHTYGRNSRRSHRRPWRRGRRTLTGHPEGRTACRSLWNPEITRTRRAYLELFIRYRFGVINPFLLRTLSFYIWPIFPVEWNTRQFIWIRYLSYVSLFFSICPVREKRRKWLIWIQFIWEKHIPVPLTIRRGNLSGILCAWVIK